MKRKYILIILLIAVTCIILIGYTAFQIRIKINPENNNWNIEITNITVKTVKQNAKKIIDPIISETSATFKNKLQTKGDSMTYEVTVANKGTIPAKVEKIEMTKSNNKNVNFTSDKINKNDLLEPGKKQKFTVTVSYDENAELEEAIDTTFSIKLDYIQN